MMSNNTNRARDPRSLKRLKTPIHIHYGPYQNAVISGRCLDISTGGVYLKTELPLSVGEHLSLILNLPNRPDPVSCNAKVVWTNPAIGTCKPGLPPGVGLEFIDLTSDELAAIKKFLETN